MRPKEIEKHIEGCGGIGHLQHIEHKAGKQSLGIYRCYNCGESFSVVCEG